MGSGEWRLGEGVCQLYTPLHMLQANQGNLLSNTVVGLINIPMLM